MTVSSKIIAKIRNNEYSVWDLKSMFYGAIEGNPELVEVIKTFYNADFTIKQEVLGVTREEMVEKGLIKPATTVPCKDRVLVLDDDECDGDSLDILIAKRLIKTQKRAKERGLEFNLGFKEMKMLLSRKTCYYSGVKLNSISHDPHQRTIDRIDSRIGYVKGNVVACCLKYNHIKEMLLEGNSNKYLTNTKELKMFVSKLK